MDVFEYALEDKYLKLLLPSDTFKKPKVQESRVPRTAVSPGMHGAARISSIMSLLGVHG